MFCFLNFKGTKLLCKFEKSEIIESVHERFLVGTTKA